ncbi:Crp/Fnr family transcriptional regulator [Hydrogenovibrio sp. SC-1]|uniref:cyclic nucleotide-binding domain-containing protein n=1 Tax=Hydrogenovibrio sp. SC-1 TaxID=2065820 RepID=UPI000C7AE944|nr:cyclic nucleotide-binding domain-containing protein [Hydrogenovibrio sp. SC-1]PLA74915.1 Crp/Fnr family transcriptional regulator [Hydrogenovibrio sp. SC-1]
MTEKYSSFQASCANCGLKGICFAQGLHDSEMQVLDELVDRTPCTLKGELLYSAGDPFTKLYAIRAGGVKVFSCSDTGEEIIHGFYLPGDIIGLESMAFEHHQYSAVALDTTSVCGLPYQRLAALGAKISNLNIQLFNLMSYEIVSSRQHARLLTQKSAEQRLAEFLWNMSQKFQSRGYEHLQFRLNVLHREVASFLNLTPETISRILGKFHQAQILTWKRKEVTIHQERLLKACATGQETQACSGH